MCVSSTSAETALSAAVEVEENNRILAILAAKRASCKTFPFRDKDSMAAHAKTCPVCMKAGRGVVRDAINTFNVAPISGQE